MSTNEDKSVESLLNELSFNSEGLIPAVAQQFDSQEVLMLAWMNRDSIEATLDENRVVYWSRSRKSLWRKGDTSGHIQNLVELRWDCDNDSILLLVDQTGVACHTGRRNCFFRTIRDGKITTLANVDIDPAGAVSIGIVRSKSPTSFPYHFDMVERHPLGSQAFIPLTEFVFVVVVARPAEFVRVEDLHAFVTNGKQGVNYHRGTWHMPLIAMAEGQEFLVVDRSPAQDNCEELILERPAVLEL